MSQKVRWGILATGDIAHQFAQSLALLDDAELVAVGSRREASARAFAEQYQIPNAHGSYQALVDDPQVEVVYVSTPHNYHRDNVRLALEAGKAVLCEKPLTVNAREASEIIDLARSRKLFLMEAMWTRFLPLTVKLRELVSGGAIGALRMVQVDFGSRFEIDPQSRIFSPELAGGALLDVGVYPLAFVSMLLGTPTSISGHAHMGETGVDEQDAMVLAHPGGALALVFSAVRTQTPQEATLVGSAGYIRLHAPWWRPTALTLSRSGHADERIEAPYEGLGYQYEAAEVMRCLHDKKLESEVMPLDESLSVMQTMDTLRAQWGLRYPFEGEV